MSIPNLGRPGASLADPLRTLVELLTDDQLPAGVDAAASYTLGRLSRRLQDLAAELELPELVQLLEAHAQKWVGSPVPWRPFAFQLESDTGWLQAMVDGEEGLASSRLADAVLQLAHYLETVGAPLPPPSPAREVVQQLRGVTAAVDELRTSLEDALEDAQTFRRVVGVAVVPAEQTAFVACNDGAVFKMGWHTSRAGWVELPPVPGTQEARSATFREQVRQSYDLRQNAGGPS